MANLPAGMAGLAENLSGSAVVEPAEQGASAPGQVAMSAAETIPESYAAGSEGEAAPEPRLGSDDAPATEAAPDVLRPPISGTAPEARNALDEESASGAADEAATPEWQAPLNEALEVAYRTLEVAVSSMQSGIEAGVHVAQAGMDEATKAAEAAASLSERSDVPAGAAADCADED
jgi:hypothetical protein